MVLRNNSKWSAFYQLLGLPDFLVKIWQILHQIKMPDLFKNS